MREHFILLSWGMTPILRLTQDREATGAFDLLSHAKGADRFGAILRIH